MNIKQNIIVLVVLLIGVQKQDCFAQSLDSLLALATAQNPKLRALEKRYEAAVIQTKNARQLDQPTIGVGIPILQPETRLGPQILMVSASQMFPWFGALDAEEDVLISMSKQEYEKISALKLDLFYRVKINYYELLYLYETQDLLEEEIKLLKSLETLSLIKMETGQGAMTDVLRIQMKMETIKNDIMQIKNDEAMAIARINEITNQSITNFEISSEDTLTLPELYFDLALFQERIEKHHPLAKLLQAQTEASENRLIVNKTSNSPSIGIGLDYALVGQRTDANPAGNGRDIFIPKVMLRIPIYRNTYHNTRKVEALNQEVLAYEKTALVNQLTSELAVFKSTYENTLLSFEVSNKQIAIAKQAFEILKANYTADHSVFDDLISLEQELLLFKKQKIISMLRAHIAVANIERLTNF
ncbi:TolC family protein [Crocinitomix algicola]|uniref:TolC family protein n=1 Tax=Crocinitomix algicola TaxID=1740263 RepID=UPI000833B98C|nr:TolC family protein [Crocinitomix algicola]